MIYGFLVYFPIDKILLFLYNTIHPLRGTFSTLRQTEAMRFEPLFL